MLHTKISPFEVRLDRLGRGTQAEPKVVRVHQVDGVLVRFEDPPTPLGSAMRASPPSAELIEAGLRHVAMLGLDGQHEAVVIKPKWPLQDGASCGPSPLLDVQVVGRAAALSGTPQKPALSPTPQPSGTAHRSRADWIVEVLTALVGLNGMAALVAALGLGDQDAGLGLLSWAAALVLATGALVAVAFRTARQTE